MKTAYKNDMPMLKLKIKGSKGQIEYDAYLDTGAGRTLIPEKDAKKFSFHDPTARANSTRSG
jgi:hypothetical protein